MASPALTSISPLFLASCSVYLPDYYDGEDLNVQMTQNPKADRGELVGKMLSKVSCSACHIFSIRRTHTCTFFFPSTPLAMLPGLESPRLSRPFEKHNQLSKRLEPSATAGEQRAAFTFPVKKQVKLKWMPLHLPILVPSKLATLSRSRNPVYLWDAKWIPNFQRRSRKRAKRSARVLQRKTSLPASATTLELIMGGPSRATKGSHTAPRP